MSFDFDVVWEYLPLLLRACITTLEISAASAVLGTIIGLGCALLRGMGYRIPNVILRVYIWMMRGLPPLVVVLFTYYGLPFFSISLDPLTAGIAAIALSVGAFWAEIFRSGIEAIPVGQWDAARALGFKRIFILRLVVLPQAFRIIVPPYLNGLIALVKETSLVSAITVHDLTMTSQRAYAASFRPFEILTTSALLYLCMTSTIMGLQEYIERRMARSAI